MLGTKQELINAIKQEVEKYIGYSYGEDVHFSDYLTINKNTYKVAHTSSEPGWKRDSDFDYYNMMELIKSTEPFLYAPDVIEVEFVVLKYYPSQSVTRFVELASDAIVDFIDSGYVEEAMIGVSHGDAKPEVFVPEELEEVDEDEALDEFDEGYSEYEYEERPIRKYVCRNNQGKELVPNVDNLIKLAIEMSHTIDGFDTIIFK